MRDYSGLMVSRAYSFQSLQFPGLMVVGAYDIVDGINDWNSGKVIMAGSLQDQLLNMGVATKQQAKSAKQQKRKKAKQAKQAPKVEQSDAQVRQQALQKAREEKAAHDRELNQQREEARRQKETQLQARQIVEKNRQPLPAEGAVSYNFSHGSVIKTIYVDKKQLEMLAVGTLAVARQEDKYWLLEGEIARKVAALHAELIVSHHEKEEMDEDDPYKDYQIPDDLMW
ncbi:MAG: DUF2058 domain-containing protein [Marinobacterium sp.]|nr:DUF2058 domain-containing protein [Marinobacterium sp.]